MDHMNFNEFLWFPATFKGDPYDKGVFSSLTRNLIPPSIIFDGASSQSTFY